MARLHILFTLLLLLILSVSVSAKSLMAEGDTIVDKPVSFGKRFSFHTNLVDWGLTIPNIGVEFDFSGKRTGHYSIAAHVKYRPNILQGVNPIKTHSTVNPRFVFNVLQVRGEIRKYWRTFVYGNVLREEYRVLKIVRADSTISVNGKDSVTVKYKKAKDVKKKSFFLTHLIRKYLMGAQRKKARDWRAYYLGLYASADKFTYNFDANGRMGSGVSAGLTAGYTFPMYPMRNGASIDLDLGLSVGARMQKYTKFKYDEETHCYVNRGFQDWEVVKRPVLADAHVSLVYRFNSIDNKVRGCDERFKRVMERYQKRIQKKDEKVTDTLSATQMHFEKIRDSLIHSAKNGYTNRVKKAANDSIEAVNKKAEKEKAKEEAKAAKEKAKEEAKAAKEKAKAEKEQAKAAKKEEQPEVKQAEAEPEAEKKEEQPEVQDEQKGGDE